MTFDSLARLVGLPSGIQLREFDWVKRANELTAPTLILHVVSDDSVPATISEVLRHRRPDLMDLDSFGTGHTLAWSADPEK